MSVQGLRGVRRYRTMATRQGRRYVSGDGSPRAATEVWSQPGAAQQRDRYAADTHVTTELAVHILPGSSHW